MPTIEELCREHDLLILGKDGVIRVPFLVKGALRVLDGKEAARDYDPEPLT